MRVRRNRLVHLMAVAALAAGVPSAAASPASAGTAGVSPCPVSNVVVWTGASGDGLWDTPANWNDPDGGHRVPTATDAACIDTAVGVVDVPDGTPLRSLLVYGDPAGPVVQVGAVTVTYSVYAVGHVRLVAPQVAGTPTTLGALLYGDGTEVAAGADVRAADVARAVASDNLHLDVAGTITYGGRVYLEGTTVVRSGGLIRPGTLPEHLLYEQFAFRGALDIQPGGSVLVTRPWEAWFVDSHMVGGQPDLVDADVLAGATEPVVARGETGIIWVSPRSTLTLVPEAGRLSLRSTAREGDRVNNSGTLHVLGPALSGGLPVGTVETGRFWNLDTGTATFDRVRVSGVVRNEGHLRLQDVIVDDPTPTPPVLVDNTGTLELAPTDAAFLHDASAVIAGAMANAGSVVGPSSAALVLDGGKYSGVGTMGVPLLATNGTFAPGPRPMRLPALGWRGQRFTFDAEGLAAGQADRFLVGTAGRPHPHGTTDAAPDSQLELAFGGGYVPCGGARWQLMSWTNRQVADPVERNRLVPSGLPAGVTVSLQERSDGYVAVASSAPTDPSSCSDPAGARFVSGLFVDGLGRPATATELSANGARAASAAGRKAVARELLAGDLATRRFVDAELRRILGRPVAAASVAGFSARIRLGLAPDAMRAEVYGDAGFYANSGRTVDGWARAFYKTELGRTISSRELLTVRSQLRAGLSRATVARYLLAGGEADRALAARSIDLWWARPATTAERATWAAQYATTIERSVTASLAAAAPIA